MYNERKVYAPSARSETLHCFDEHDFPPFILYAAHACIGSHLWGSTVNKYFCLFQLLWNSALIMFFASHSMAKEFKGSRLLLFLRLGVKDSESLQWDKLNWSYLKLTFLMHI